MPAYLLSDDMFLSEVSQTSARLTPLPHEPTVGGGVQDLRYNGGATMMCFAQTAFFDFL